MQRRFLAILTRPGRVEPVGLKARNFDEYHIISDLGATAPEADRWLGMAGVLGVDRGVISRGTAVPPGPPVRGEDDFRTTGPARGVDCTGDETAEVSG